VVIAMLLSYVLSGIWVLIVLVICTLMSLNCRREWFRVDIDMGLCTDFDSFIPKWSVY